MSHREFKKEVGAFCREWYNHAPQPSHIKRRCSKGYIACLLEYLLFYVQCNFHNQYSHTFPERLGNPCLHLTNKQKETFRTIGARKTGSSIPSIFYLSQKIKKRAITSFHDSLQSLCILSFLFPLCIPY